MKKPSPQPLACGKRPGYSSLIAVLVTAAVGVAIVAAVSFVGVSALKSGQAAERSSRARVYADACAEEALFQLRRDTAYTGGTVMSFTGGDCEVIAVTGTGDTGRVVQAQGTVAGFVRRVQVSVTEVQPTFTLDDWQEVSAF